MEFSPGMCAETGNYRMAEAEKGYYVASDNLLYYADKENLSFWTVVCNDLSCNHLQEPACPAHVGYDFRIENGRIFSIRDPQDMDPKAEPGDAVFSTAADGTDLRLEFRIPDSSIEDGGCGTIQPVKTGYLCAYSLMQKNGLFQNRILYTDGKVAETLHTGETEEMAMAMPLMTLQGWFGVRGDTAVFSEILSGKGNEQKKAYGWNGTAFEEIPNIMERSQYELLGAYLNGNTLDYFVADDGYYREDLTTGETVRQQDCRIPGSRACHMTEQYIVETNLYRGSGYETPRIEIFDGNSWNAVTIPEDFSLGEKDGFSATAISTEYIFFRKTDQKNTMLYAVSLTDPEYKLIPCGVLEKPKAQS